MFQVPIMSCKQWQMGAAELGLVACGTALAVSPRTWLGFAKVI